MLVQHKIPFDFLDVDILRKKSNKMHKNFQEIKSNLNEKTFSQSFSKEEIVLLRFLTNYCKWSELPRKFKTKTFDVFLEKLYQKCSELIISCFYSIVGIAIKRLVHIAGLQVNPSSQNLGSKLKSGPNYPV
jgi:hypothetical protein